jgi:hypothetical protein
MMSLRKKHFTSGNQVLELGFGGGFFKDLYPEIITSGY